MADERPVQPFIAFWNRRWPFHHPVGFMLRESGAKHWIRLHALPGSRRHPRTADEHAEWMHRATTLASATLGTAEPCWLVQAVAADTVADADRTRDCHGHPLARAYAFAEDHDDGTSTVWSVHAGPVMWADGAFEPLLSAIASGEEASTLWVSQESGTIFAPYDGGFDVFVATRREKDGLGRRFADWRA
jgi:hypothetical protein